MPLQGLDKGVGKLEKLSITWGNAVQTVTSITEGRQWG